MASRRASQGSFDLSVPMAPLTEDEKAIQKILAEHMRETAPRGPRDPTPVDLQMRDRMRKQRLANEAELKRDKGSWIPRDDVKR